MDAFADQSLLDSAGLAGVVLYLGSYAALQAGFIRGSSYLYAALNAAAAALVLVSLTRDFNLSSAIIQVAWITISIVGMARLYYVRNWTRFDSEDMQLLAAKFPHLPNDMATRLIRSGKWLDLEEGTVLTRDGLPNDHFYYLANSPAHIERDGQRIATCEPGDFVGEITCFDGRPANGTVSLAAPARVFAIPTGMLQRLAPPESAMRQAFEKAIADDLRVKLARSGQTGGA